MKFGQLTIVGRPNVGKSTLLNALVREKVAIVSDKPQTTRNPILGVGHYPEGQLVVVDTPGFHTPHHRLNAKMIQAALGVLPESDLVYVMVDGQVPPGPGDRQVVDEVIRAHTDQPFRGIFLLLNKIDVLAKSRLLPLIDQYRTWFPWTEILPLSAQTGLNVTKLVELSFRCLAESSVPLYDEDFLTNQSLRHMAGEIVREQILARTYAELPYAVGVLIEEFQEDKHVTDIRAVILVDKASQKRIVVGKGGAQIKEIGQAARLEMERLFGMKIFLRLFVKVKEGWRDNDPLLSQLGYGNHA